MSGNDRHSAKHQQFLLFRHPRLHQSDFFFNERAVPIMLRKLLMLERSTVNESKFFSTHFPLSLTFFFINTAMGTTNGLRPFPNP